MIDSIISLIVAAALLLGSPGPTPLTLAATGAVFGFRRGLPFLLGIICGLAAVVLLGAVGLVAIFEAVPASRIVMQILGAIYIAYIAYKIATAPVVSNGQSIHDAAPKFRDGVIFNLLNPKAYAVLVSLLSQFHLPFDSPLISTVTVGVIALGVGIVVDVLWLALGGVLRPVFEAPVAARVVRIGFAIAMVAAVIVGFRLG